MDPNNEIRAPKSNAEVQAKILQSRHYGDHQKKVEYFAILMLSNLAFIANRKRSGRVCEERYPRKHGFIIVP